MYISDPSPHYMLCLVPQIMAEFYGKVSRWEAQRYPNKNDPPACKWNGHWNDPKQGHSDWQTLLGPPVPTTPMPTLWWPPDLSDPPKDPVSTPSLPQIYTCNLFHPPPYTCETPPGHSNFRHWSFHVSGQQCMGRLQDTHRWEEEDLS